MHRALSHCIINCSCIICETLSLQSDAWKQFLIHLSSTLHITPSLCPRMVKKHSDQQQENVMSPFPSFLSGPVERTEKRWLLMLLTHYLCVIFSRFFFYDALHYSNNPHDESHWKYFFRFSFFPRGAFTDSLTKIYNTTDFKQFYSIFRDFSHFILRIIKQLAQQHKNFRNTKEDNDEHSQTNTKNVNM